jgi:thioredoxin reductase (NADPH)
VSIREPLVVHTDVLIIGAGPSGLFASYYAGLRGLSVVLVDSLPQAGGQLMALYPDKPIYDVAGVPEASGAELTASLVRQAELAKPTWLLGEQALDLTRASGQTGDDIGPGHSHTVVTDKGTVVRAHGVVVAAGIGSFRPRRLHTADSYLGRGLTYAFRDSAAYQDLDVVIVGGGDTAVDWANMLAARTRSLTVVHRRPTLRAHAKSVERLRRSATRLMLGSEVIDAHGREHIEAVTVDTGSGVERIKAQAVIAALGHHADLGPLSRWGLELDGRHILVDRRLRTNIPGVFAVGDVTAHPGKVRIMAVGFGEAATAINNLAVELRPGEAVFPGHSTELMHQVSPRTSAEEAIPWPT